MNMALLGLMRLKFVLERFLEIEHFHPGPGS